MRHVFGWHALLVVGAILAAACDPDYSVRVRNETGTTVFFCTGPERTCTGNSALVRLGETAGLHAIQNGRQIGTVWVAPQGGAPSLELSFDNELRNFTTLIVLSEEPTTRPINAGKATDGGFELRVENSTNYDVAASLLSDADEETTASAAPGRVATLRTGRGREIASIILTVGDRYTYRVEFSDGLHQGLTIWLPGDALPVPTPLPLDPRLCKLLPEGCSRD